MALNYTTYIQAMQNLLVVPTDNVDTNFQNIIPRMIEYAELRIYREMDFLVASSALTTPLVTTNRSVTVPTGIFIVEQINIVTPASQTIPDDGTRNPLQRVSLDYLNAVYSTPTTGIPTCYAMLSDTVAKLGPPPDNTYTAEFVGVVRPAPLSPANTTTYLTTNLPDLFVAASMVFGTGYQANFGSQADNPQQAQSWEATYQTLKQGVSIEDARQKAQSASWYNDSPNPLANVPRERASQ